MTISLHDGLDAHRSGDLKRAESVYRRLGEMPDALAALAVLLHQSNRTEEGVRALERAISLRPSIAEWHANRAAMLTFMGRPAAAAAKARRAALVLDPRLADSHVALQAVLPPDALEDRSLRLSRALALQAEASWLNELALILDGSRRSESLWRRALALAPSYMAAHGNLGNRELEQKKADLAVRRYLRVIAAEPANAVARLMLGSALVEAGRAHDGILALRRALDLRPGYPKAHLNLGWAYARLRQVGEAAGHFQQALRHEPTSPEALSGLGQMLKEQGRTVEADLALRKSLVLAPASAGAHGNRGRVLLDEGQIELALPVCRRAIALMPSNLGLWSNWLLGLHFSVGVGAEEIASAHRGFGRVMGEAGGRLPARRRGAGDRLRIGFVSADFRRHAVAWFLLPVLSGRRPGAWEAVCYSDVTVEDEVSREFRRLADRFQPIVGVSDERLVDVVRADGIDVVFDLAGHTSGNRLGAFARRLAPVQATWLGYADTTGLASMDVLVADRIVVPEGTEDRYVERVERLADGFACYQPPLEAEPVAPLPALGGAPFTFGCLTQLAKVNDAVLDLWARALAAAPKSRLMVQSGAFDDPAGRARMQARLAALGVAERRLSLVGRLPHRQILKLFAGVDLMLDTFPMGGGTTTCEALWHGVPVLTLPSDLYCGRHTASHLANLGLEGFTATDPQDFVAKAAAWATDPEALAAIRSTLRPRMAASPLADKTRFANSFLNLINRIVA